jgi:hypothetical protein
MTEARVRWCGEFEVPISGAGKLFIGTSNSKPHQKSNILLTRDELRITHHRALVFCLHMIFSESRYTLFRIMLSAPLIPEFA